MENPDQEEFTPSPEEPPFVESPTIDEPESSNPRPALVINLYSWATPVAAVVMLLVGLLLGYFGRPLLSSNTSTGSSAQPTQVSQAGSGGLATPTVDIMAFLVSKTQHFKGNQNAPVTFIEFSDYQ
jgi:hypothetical protein